MDDQGSLTPEEAALLLRVNVRTVYRALQSGKLPGGKVGNQWRIPRVELEAHLRGEYRGGTGTKANGGGLR